MSNNSIISLANLLKAQVNDHKRDIDKLVFDKRVWQQTLSGQINQIGELKPEDIRLDDVAASLSKICRYNGHIKVFLSVAEHSVEVSRVVPEEYAAWALLHDAHEAYVGDIIRPMCHLIGPNLINEIKDTYDRAIAERFGLSAIYNDAGAKREIRYADDRMLMTERELFLNKPPQSWGDYLESLPHYNDVYADGTHDWVDSRRMFLDRAAELGIS